MTKNPQPWIQVFVACDDVKQDEQGFFTLIGLVDALQLNFVGPGATVEMPEGREMGTKVFLQLLGGEGNYAIRLDVVLPGGLRIPGKKLQMKLDSPLQSGKIIIDLFIPAVRVGLAWLEAYVDDRRLGRIPLHLRYHPVNPRWN